MAGEHTSWTAEEVWDWLDQLQEGDTDFDDLLKGLGYTYTVWVKKLILFLQDHQVSEDNPNLQDHADWYTHMDALQSWLQDLERAEKPLWKQPVAVILEKEEITRIILPEMWSLFNACDDVTAQTISSIIERLARAAGLRESEL